MSSKSLSRDLEGFLRAFAVICSQHIHESFFIGSEANHLTDDVSHETHSIAFVFSVFHAFVLLAGCADVSMVSAYEVACLPHLLY